MKRIHGVALLLALVAGMPVTFLVAGGVSVPLLLLILVTAVVADNVTWSVRATSCRSWPVLQWRRGFA